MKKHTSQEAFYERMRNLSNIKSTSVNESKNRSLGTLIDFERAANGVAYGIIKEQHKYYIKKGGLNENQTVADFAYIGGVQNITDYQYGKLAEARKIRNFLLKTVNEGIETKVNPNGSKTMPTKGMLIEDKASQEIDMAASKVDDLDAATDAAAMPPAEDPLNTDGEAEMDAGIEAMDGEGGEDPLAGDMPPEGDLGGDAMMGGGEDPLAGDDMGDEEDPLAGMGDEEGGGEEAAVEDPQSEATREIEKMLGKLTNDLRKTDLTEPQVKSYVNSFLSAFKDDFPDIDIEDRKAMAEKITKVVPPEDIEDLGQNVEDTDGDGIPDSEEMGAEPELEEAGCSECGSFAQYAESRGYDVNTIKECGEEEMSSLVSGYANAHSEGENDGDHKSVALFIKLMPKVLDILKSEYGHEDYADELEPEVNSMDESTAEDLDAQINELFGGLGHLAKKAGQGIKKGAQAMGQNIKQGAQNMGQAVADKTQQVGQAVGQAATNVKQSYHAGEKNAALDKLEKVAANLGKQIAQVNSQAQKAGQEPINVNSILTTIKNQVGGSSGAADLSKFRTNEEGIPIDHTEVQPMMEDDNIEEDVTVKVAEKKGKPLSPKNVPTKEMKEGEEEKVDDVETGEDDVLDLTKHEEPEMPMISGVDSMGGGVVKPEGAETTTVEVTKDSVNVTMNEAIDVMNEMLGEISTGLAQKAYKLATNKANQHYNNGEDLHGDVRDRQASNINNYVNPEIKKELDALGIKAHSLSSGDDGLNLQIPTSNGDVLIAIDSDGYSVTSGDVSNINSQIQRRLLRVIEMIKKDLVQPQDPNELEESQMNETELKLRKYIRNRLQEHAGLRKPSLNENKKSKTLLKLDKMIDKQFNLYETVVKNKIDKKMKK